MILFLLSLLICIILHELAHLIIAKKVGCNVEVFSIGFGKPFYSFEYKGTRYNFTPFLFGGYCRVKGENEINPDPDAFCNLTYTHKLFMIFAGCIVNIIAGVISFYLGKKFGIYNLTFFGYLSIALGIGNLLPIPALDGSYPILVWLEKFYGKEKGYKLMTKINRIGFAILMTLNIICILLLISMVIGGIK